MSAYNKGYRRSNKEKIARYHKEWQRHRYEERRAAIRGYKEGRCCADCGVSGKDEALLFHHPDPKTKRGNIGMMLCNSSDATLWAEIKKCILLCRHCHPQATQQGTHTP